MKKILAILLAAAMVLSMVACGGNNTDNKTTEENKTTEATKGDDTTADNGGEELSEYEAFIQECKEYYEANGSYKYKVVFTMYNWFGMFPGQARINEALNKITHEEVYLDIEFNMTGASDFKTAVPLALSSGETVGWYGANMVGAYSSNVNNGYCQDLEAAGIREYAPDVIDLVGETFIDGCRLGGTLYCITGMRDIAIDYGYLMIGKEYLDGIGYEYVEGEDQAVHGVTWDEVDEIFAKLHAQYPDIPVWTTASNWFTQASKIDSLGGDSFGVLEDPINSTTVTNLYGCDEWNNTLNRVHNWNKLGYIPTDFLTETLGMNSLIKAGRGMAMISQGKPGYKSQISGECGREMICFQMGKPIVKSGATTNVIMCLAWNVGEDDPDEKKAYMVMLNLMYTNKEAAQLYCWGEEGKEYKYTEDGHVTFADGVDAGTSEWYHTCNWAMPNQYLATAWVGDPLDLGEKTMEFNKNAEVSKGFGFAFDNSKYSTEFTALTNKYNELYKPLLLGFDDPVEGTEKLNKEMEANGLSTYIEAKTEAFNAWLAK